MTLLLWRAFGSTQAIWSGAVAAICIGAALAYTLYRSTFGVVQGWVSAAAVFFFVGSFAVCGMLLWHSLRSPHAPMRGLALFYAIGLFAFWAASTAVELRRLRKPTADAT